VERCSGIFSRGLLVPSPALAASFACCSVSPLELLLRGVAEYSGIEVDLIKLPSEKQKV
jgi:hypothetical protein